ncbi:MAG: EamA family transporter [Candidatus Zixiibacteriota bacterium]|nr:MAG: EamA family transporter [candidate division Zixibacteria bacterium]
MASQRNLIFTLIIATFAVSWASILIKLSGAEALPTAFYRMALASAILAIPAVPRLIKIFPKLTGQQLILLFLSGLALGLHFATWVTSLFYTTISNSVILVATQPVFLMIMETILLKEKIVGKAILGMLMALCGMIIITGGDISLGAEHLRGDLLALAGAFFAGIYLLIGRKLRVDLNNLEYIFIVYSIAALFLLIISLSYNENITDYPARTWIFFLLLALIPTVVGHSLYNWLLKYIPAYRVATVILGEPIGATILAIFFFYQIPGWWTMIGGVMILLGIYIVLRQSGKTKPGG